MKKILNSVSEYRKENGIFGGLKEALVTIHSTRGHRGLGMRIGRSRVVIGDMIKSEYFVENYDDDVRHIAVMQHVQAVSKMNIPKKQWPVAAKKVDIT